MRVPARCLHLGRSGQSISLSLMRGLLTSAIRLDQSGDLLNTAQGNCPSTLSTSACPKDKNGDSGHLINHLYKYQCAYPAGACTWDGVSAALRVFVGRQLTRLLLRIGWQPREHPPEQLLSVGSLLRAVNTVGITRN